MGNLSPPLVLITAFIMGLVLTLQTSLPGQFRRGGPASGNGVGFRDQRDRPVITAIICAGKIGSRIGTNSDQ
jgi:phospholipid/cholesterol/gamma-HCH transport system permease protein